MAAEPTPRYPYLHLQVSADESELAALALWELGAAGIEERDGSTLLPGEGDSATLVANFASEEAARAALEQLAGRYRVQLHFVEGDGWRDAWKQYFHLQRIGQRLLVRPPWEPYEPAAGEEVVVMDPGRAFGTGTHATTRLVLKQLEAHVRGGERVLDVGCGSGILGIAALKLGAANCLALDNDPEAVQVTLENAAINGVAAHLQASSMDDLPPGATPQAFDWVLANIEAKVLLGLVEPLCGAVAPGGRLVLSGLLAEQEGELLRAYAALTHIETVEENGWVAIVLQR